MILRASLESSLEEPTFTPETKTVLDKARKPFVSKPSLPERPMTRLVTPEQVLPKKPAFAESAPPPVDGPSRIDELDEFVPASR